MHYSSDSETQELPEYLIMDLFLKYELSPNGVLSKNNFWKLVDEAKQLNPKFANFCMAYIRAQVGTGASVIFGNNRPNEVTSYKSSFNNWSDLYSQYKNYCQNQQV